MVDNNECFAYIPFGNHGKCGILNHADCQFCSFFKTKEEFQKDLAKYPPDLSKFVMAKR